MSEIIDENEHIGLICSVAQELANTEEVCIRSFGKDVSEYLGEGFIALRIAIKNFKPELGYKFSTYATQVIRDKLIQAARRSTLVRVSYQARYQACLAMYGKDIPEKNAKKIKDAMRAMNNGTLPIAEYGDKGAEDKIPLWEITEELAARLNELDDRTRAVIVMRYGLDGKEPLTLEEVGNALEPSVTRERVRQIEKKGLDKLRTSINR